MRFSLLLVATLAVAACGEHSDAQCVCTDLFASIGVNVVHTDGQPALGLDAKTVHLASGTIVHALNDNPTGFYTIADDSTALVEPGGDQFRFMLLSGTAEIVSRDVDLRTDSCGCHIGSTDMPQSIVVP